MTERRRESPAAGRGVRTLTYSVKATVSMAAYEPLTFELTESVVVGPDESYAEAAASLKRRVQRSVEADVVEARRVRDAATRRTTGTSRR